MNSTGFSLRTIQSKRKMFLKYKNIITRKIRSDKGKPNKRKTPKFYKKINKKKI
jgi:hypothetical protein